MIRGLDHCLSVPLFCLALWHATPLGAHLSSTRVFSDGMQGIVFNPLLPTWLGGELSKSYGWQERAGALYMNTCQGSFAAYNFNAFAFAAAC